MSMTELLDSESYSMLVNCFRVGLRDSAIKFFDESDFEPYQKVVIIESIMTELGKAWEEHKIPLTSLYVASRITEDIADTLFSDPSSLSERNGTIVIGTLTEDYHSLGKNIIKRFLWVRLYR